MFPVILSIDLGTTGNRAIIFDFSLLILPGALRFWNIPEKERFLRLTPEQQRPVVELKRSFAGAATVCLTVVMLALQIGIYLTAQGHTKGLPWYIQIALFGPAIGLVIGVFFWMNAMERVIVKASSSE